MPNKKKRKCPWFWRRRTSCPDCGLIVEEGEAYDGGFNCSRCGTHYASEDFWDSNVEKNLWAADLNSELVS